MNGVAWELMGAYLTMATPLLFFSLGVNALKSALRDFT